MSEIVNRIKYAMSLRTPQEEALSYLDAISSHCDYKKDSKDVIEAAASEYCEKQRKVKAGFEFPSFCYAMATGIGKTRLMGASIYYLYKTKGYKHFFILAPGNTIYEKLRKESNPNHPKYIFKGLESEMGRPKVYDGENYDTYPIKYDQMTLIVEKTSDIQLFIFNIGKIFNSKTDTQFNFHKFKETLGASFADVLAQFDDLVICMDEAHRYYAPASMKAINYLKPVFGLEFTATPKTTSNVIYAYDLARGAVEGTTATPFSARARDRVMHALIISAIRLNFPNMANNPDAAAIGSLTTEQLDSVKKLIIDRLNIIKPSARADAEEEIDRFIDWWKLQAAQTKPLRYYVVGTERYNRLMNPYDQPHDENEKATLRSMREVESSANMFYYTED